MADKIKLKNTLSTIAIVALLLAIPSIWPYGYYQILRWLITGIAIFVAHVSSKLEKTMWVLAMSIVAILFNPIAPIYLAKETWVVIDLVTAVLFGISIFKIQLSIKNENK